MVFCLFNAKGGVGKTMFAFNFAFKSAQYGKTLLLDIDPQQSVSVWKSYRKSELPFDTIYSTHLKDLPRFSKDYKFVVIDSGGFDSDINKEALFLSQVVLIPINLCPLAISVYNSISNLLQNHSAETFCILNKIPANPKLKSEVDSIQNYINSKQDNITLLNSILYDRIAYTQSIAQGLSIYESKSIKAINDFDSVYMEIISNLIKE